MRFVTAKDKEAFLFQNGTKTYARVEFTVNEDGLDNTLTVNLLVSDNVNITLSEATDIMNTLIGDKIEQLQAEGILQ